MRGRQGSARGEEMMEAEVRGRESEKEAEEGGGGGPLAKGCRGLQKLEKTRKQSLPRSLQEKYSPANTLVLAPWG